MAAECGDIAGGDRGLDNARKWSQNVSVKEMNLSGLKVGGVQLEAGRKMA